MSKESGEFEELKAEVIAEIRANPHKYPGVCRMMIGRIDRLEAEASKAAHGQAAAEARGVAKGMRAMREAPRDGTEIMAFHIDGGNFHPVCWITADGAIGSWRMRWNAEYCCTDYFYSGWIPYPAIISAAAEPQGER